MHAYPAFYKGLSCLTREDWRLAIDQPDSAAGANKTNQPTTTHTPGGEIPPELSRLPLRLLPHLVPPHLPSYCHSCPSAFSSGCSPQCSCSYCSSSCCCCSYYLGGPRRRGRQQSRRPYRRRGREREAPVAPARGEARPSGERGTKRPALSGSPVPGSNPVLHTRDRKLRPNAESGGARRGINGINSGGYTVI